MTEREPDRLTLACDELEASLLALFPDKAAEVRRVRAAYAQFATVLGERAATMSASAVIAFVEEQARHTVAIQQLQEQAP